MFLPLAERVLQVIAAGGETPILAMVDTQGQRMARRDEMLGLNEYLAHLAKCLLLASREGIVRSGWTTAKRQRARSSPPRLPPMSSSPCPERSRG